MSQTIRIYEKEQIVTAKQYDNRECWVPGKDTLVTVTRKTKGNLMDPYVYKLPFGEAVKRGYLSDNRGTMSFSVYHKQNEPLHWIVGLNTFGILFPSEYDKYRVEAYKKYIEQQWRENPEGPGY